MNSLLALVLSVAVVLILGRLHSYYLDENDRIMRGQRKFDH